jgi:phosphatidylserine/phosphatidylglycerophosphate/cardiolipin synthase-like enzyme
VVLDKSQLTEKYSAADFLVNFGISTYIDSNHSIAHSKTMCIDKSTLITGSFNFTKAAENSNLENLLVIKNNTQLLKAYIDNFFLHKAHSVLYRGRDNAGAQTGEESENHKKKSGGWRSLLDPLLKK